jgi:hypothetical protein
LDALDVCCSTLALALFAGLAFAFAFAATALEARALPACFGFGAERVRAEGCRFEALRRVGRLTGRRLP